MLHADVYSIENHREYKLSILECRRTEGTTEWIVFDPRYHEANNVDRLQVPFSSFSEAAGLYRAISYRAIEEEIDAMRPPNENGECSHE